MRVDKYLKTSRVIKRRVVAKEAADKSKVEINGKTAKPSSILKIGDVVKLYLGAKTITIKVISFVNIKDQLMYELISEERTVK